MQKEINIVYDTSALIEFITESKWQKTVEVAFLADDTQNYIPAIVLVEFISKLEREKIDPSKFVKVFEENAVILSLTPEVAKEAGYLHAKLKKKEKFISLADCIIMSHGKSKHAKILTKDSHFKYYKNAQILGS